jgi:hypothetical protein
MTKPGMKLGKLKASHLLIALGVVTVLAGYGWRLYALFRDSQMNMPQPQIEKLTRDFRIYHVKTGHFPETFIEINNLIWRTKPTPNYGNAGRQARTKNYYYFYTKVNNHTCTIWALPIGPRRQYASSFFVVLSPNWVRHWTGEALNDEAIVALPAIPSSDRLAELKMREIPGKILADR